MTQIANKKTQTQKMVAEADASLWVRLKKQEADARDRAKGVAERLHNYASENRTDFGGKNTMKLGEVKLVFTNESKIKTGKTFNLTDFAEEYPECIKCEIKTSELKGLMVSERLAKEIRDNFDIDVEQVETFKVEKA